MKNDNFPKKHASYIIILRVVLDYNGWEKNNFCNSLKYYYLALNFIAYNNI